MDKIWAVSSGAYSDYGVDYIFESEEEARALADALNENTGDEYNRTYRAESFDLVPAGTKINWWPRLEITWYAGQEGIPERVEEDITACHSLKHTPMPKPRVHRTTDLDERWNRGFLLVEGDDHERVRKVFTEQLAGYKLELPLLRATQK